MTTYAAPVEAPITDQNGQISQAWRAFLRGVGGNQAKVGDYLQSIRQDIGAGWLLCDGSAVSQTDYPALYAVMQAVVSPGPTPGTFKLPQIAPVYDPDHPAPNGPPILQTWVKGL